jgi:hypothetical protein
MFCSVVVVFVAGVVAVYPVSPDPPPKHRDARSSAITLADVVAGESEAGKASLGGAGDEGGVDRILAELDKLHAIG